MRNDITAVEAALHLCETCGESIAQAKIAIAEIQQTIERLHETRRRMEELLAKVRADSE